jgi:hypothetical protein
MKIIKDLLTPPFVYGLVIGAFIVLLWKELKDP